MVTLVTRMAVLHSKFLRNNRKFIILFQLIQRYLQTEYINMHISQLILVTRLNKTNTDYGTEPFLCNIELFHL